LTRPTPRNPDPPIQEIIFMNRLLRAGAVTLAIFNCVGFAAAQNAPSQAPRTAHINLTSTQARMVSQTLEASPSQPAPAGVQPEVGSKLPDSVAAKTLPNDVTDQVPETKNLLFVKLPDRIVLIDPDTQVVTEIVVDPATTDSNVDRSVAPSSCMTGVVRQC
jgi:hypothetical protein